MNKKLKTVILSNTFVDNVRISMEFDEVSYQELISSLHDLASEISNQDSIDRELMLFLYQAPLIIRNTYLSIPENVNSLKIVNRLEDAWIELDELVTNCLV